ncbi:TPA: YbgC/FadM family acyl-CoA thioesterase [Legionella feeleii]|uniref:Acyl-CoA thioesterase n=1 Tax=Legionella feeleii TaxID=453 RepID=A0A0W0TIK4_9GAMM|nr:YbgC/FadM family acyl-CoA thioesterase [Legionella feeleii]KTC95408.1 acyl-CoA thioesterase [Legionella feeleii]SPX59989.1 acyl-CoA thioesterase [Legionella feeleii]STX38506.1 acyl-CoA thioesterase [Legionella feeleii]
MNKSNHPEHQFDIRVYAEDTDLMGIVYHANYLCFFERARTEMIRKSGLSLTTLAKYDCHFAINEVQLHYLNPARLDDLLTIISKIDSKTACSALFKQLMYNQHKKLLCEAMVKVVCVNGHLKPRRLPDDLF